MGGEGFKTGDIFIKLLTLTYQVKVVFKNNPGVNSQTFTHQKAKRLEQNFNRLRSGKDRQPTLHRQGHKMWLARVNKFVTTAPHETILVSDKFRAKGYHAERGSQLPERPF